MIEFLDIAEAIGIDPYKFLAKVAKHPQHAPQKVRLMKIVQEETLLSCGKYAASSAWKKTRESLYKAIREVDWPPGSGTFTIYPELGKAREGKRRDAHQTRVDEGIEAPRVEPRGTARHRNLKRPGKARCRSPHRLRPRRPGMGNRQHFFQPPGVKQNGSWVA